MTGPTLTSPFKNVQQLNKGGQQFTYIPAAEVIDRLNACLPEWSFTVNVVHQDENFIVVKGQLAAFGQIYEQFGGQKINKRASEPLDLGDDFKGAASDALKKCAAMIGVGLYIALGHEPLSAKFSSGSAAQAASEDSGDGSPHPPVPAPAAGGEELPGKSAPPPRASRNKADTSKGRRSVPGETSPDVGEIESDPAGESVSPADLAPRAQIQQQIDKLTESQKLQLKSLWVENRLVPLDKAEIAPQYVEKVTTLISQVLNPDPVSA